MKTILIFTQKLFFTLLIITCFTNSYGQSVANYNITFTSVWNTNDHGTLPSGAHWSRLVGGNHLNTNEFWQLNSEASLGIENVAETGDNTVFLQEIDASILANNTEQLIYMPSVSTATGSVTISNVEIDQNFSLLTLVSMIAPSPDWFIGINSYNLRQDNSWITNATIDLFAYDAGTENGDGYSLDNSATIPQENITSLIDISPFNNQRIGYFSITLNSVLGTNGDSLVNNSIEIYPNPSSNSLVTFSKLDENLSDKIEVFNLFGKLVKEVLTTNKTHITLNLSDLETGIYLVKMTSKNGEYNGFKKLVLSKK